MSVRPILYTLLLQNMSLGQTCYLIVSMALKAHLDSCSYKCFIALRRNQTRFCLCVVFTLSVVVLQEALKVMEFTEEEIRDVFKLLSAVLQMGNIEFMTAGGAQITSKGGRRRNLYQIYCTEFVILILRNVFLHILNLRCTVETLKETYK